MRPVTTLLLVVILAQSLAIGWLSCRLAQLERDPAVQAALSIERGLHRLMGEDR